jgi:hypothetical protein
VAGRPRRVLAGPRRRRRCLPPRHPAGARPPAPPSGPRLAKTPPSTARPRAALQRTPGLLLQLLPPTVCLCVRLGARPQGEALYGVFPVLAALKAGRCGGRPDRLPTPISPRSMPTCPRCHARAVHRPTHAPAQVSAAPPRSTARRPARPQARSTRRLHPGQHGPDQAQGRAAHSPGGAGWGAVGRVEGGQGRGVRAGTAESA